jgi:hypothetical protein
VGEQDSSLRETPKSSTIPFEGAGDLPALRTTPGPPDDRFVGVHELSPTPEQLERLQRLFPDSVLSGWAFETATNGMLLLEVEDARESAIQGHVHLPLSAASSERLIAVLESLPSSASETPPGLYVSLVRVKSDDLEVLAQLRMVGRGTDGTLPKSSGWRREICSVWLSRGFRAPLAIWSWNPEESDLFAEYELRRGHMGIFAPKTELTDKPLAEWPRPVWALMACFLADS